MKQFEVYANPSARDRDIAPYVVVLQSHFLDLPTVVVAPLLRGESAERLVYLSIDVTISGDGFVVSLHELATVTLRSLRRRVADLTEQQDAIVRGLGRLFSGF
ncbi:MAG TPA: CcdB family protein [Caulobacteraceae bacterium]